MYLLIRVISKLFLTSSSTGGSQSNAKVFYNTYKQFQQGKKRSQQHQQSSKKNGNNQFEEIEEAEFEDVTDEDNQTAKSSD